MDLALGLLLRKTSSTPEVVPGAAPALAKAGVGGYFLRWLKHFKTTNRYMKPNSLISDLSEISDPVWNF